MYVYRHKPILAARKYLPSNGGLAPGLENFNTRTNLQYIKYAPK